MSANLYVCVYLQELMTAAKVMLVVQTHQIMLRILLIDLKMELSQQLTVKTLCHLRSLATSQEDLGIQLYMNRMMSRYCHIVKRVRVQVHYT